MFDFNEFSEAEGYAYLAGLGLKFFRTGSREICSPAPLDTDVDFVVLDKRGQVDFESEGFRVTSHIEDYGDATMCMYRQGEVNLIVIDDPQVFWRWKVATAAAKQMNLTDKAQRIALFQGVLYGNW